MLKICKYHITPDCKTSRTTSLELDEKTYVSNISNSMITINIKTSVRDLYKLDTIIEK